LVVLSRVGLIDPVVKKAPARNKFRTGPAKGGLCIRSGSGGRVRLTMSYSIGLIFFGRSWPESKYHRRGPLLPNAKRIQYRLDSSCFEKRDRIATRWDEPGGIWLRRIVWVITLYGIKYNHRIGHRMFPFENRWTWNETFSAPGGYKTIDLKNVTSATLGNLFPRIPGPMKIPKDGAKKTLSYAKQNERLGESGERNPGTWRDCRRAQRRGAENEASPLSESARALNQSPPSASGRGIL